MKEGFPEDTKMVKRQVRTFNSIKTKTVLAKTDISVSVLLIRDAKNELYIRY